MSFPRKKKIRSWATEPLPLPISPYTIFTWLDFLWKTKLKHPFYRKSKEDQTNFTVVSTNMQTSWEKVDNPEKYWIFFGLWVLVLVAKKTSWEKEIRDSCGKLFVIWWYIISVPLATQSVLYMHMIHPLDYHKQYRYTGTPQEMRLTQNYTESH